MPRLMALAALAALALGLGVAGAPAPPAPASPVANSVFHSWNIPNDTDGNPVRGL